MNRVLSERLRIGSLESLHSSYLPILQSDLYSMRMVGGPCQDVFDNPFGALSGALVLLQDDVDFNSRADILPISSIHDRCYS